MNLDKLNNIFRWREETQADSALSLTTPSTLVPMPDQGFFFCTCLDLTFICFNRGWAVLNSTNLRLRDKSPRSEDLEADDEQGDKTDNDHDRLSFHL